MKKVTIFGKRRKKKKKRKVDPKRQGESATHKLTAHVWINM